MKKVRDCFCLLLLSSAAWAMPLGGSARTVIPSDVQQIISVDYRALRNSETAQVLKQQVLPDSLKQFEGALKGVGINPEKAQATYRNGVLELHIPRAEGAQPKRIKVEGQQAPSNPAGPTPSQEGNGGQQASKLGAAKGSEKAGK